MKKLLIAILVLTAFFSCSENKSNLPSGSAKEVLSNDLAMQLSRKGNTAYWIIKGKRC